jgi:hypothetical protein
VKDNGRREASKETDFLIFKTWVASSFSPFASFSLSSSIALSCEKGTKPRGKGQCSCRRSPVSKQETRRRTFFSKFLIFFATGSADSGTTSASMTTGGARTTAC